MAKIDNLQTDNPQVALIVAAHNAADLGTNFGTMEPRNDGHARHEKAMRELYIERFNETYAALAEATGVKARD